jgi:hypothetical protein
MHVRIQPDFPLAETARIVGEILNVPFKVDDSGYFEEFPAYSSPHGDTRFALLGLPDAKFIGDSARHDYDLQLCKFSGTVQQHDALVTETQQRIAADGRLHSELL